MRNGAYKLILLLTILISLFNSCNNKGKSNYTDQNVIASTDSSEISIDTTLLLKYTSGIRSILEDSKGNIWFGSHEEGVCLFDGSSFTYFTKEDGLSHNQVRTIQEDGNGIIWFECGFGISSYDGKQITTHTDKNYDSKHKWEKSVNDLWFKGDKGHGYSELEGQSGVYRNRGGEFTFLTFPVPQYKDDQGIFSVTTGAIKGADGTIWFGTYEAAIGFNGESFTMIGREEMGLKDDPRNIGIRALYEDSKGNLWIGSNRHGVFIYNGDKTINFTKLHRLDKEDTNGNSLHRIFSIAEDNAGNIWFGTSESGVWRFDGNFVTNYTEKDGLTSNHITTIYKTKRGELWFGGKDPCGVFKFNGTSFERIY